MLLAPLALYNALQLVLSPFLVVRFVRRVFFRKKDHVGWRQRLGLRPVLASERGLWRDGSPRTWFFCRSLGEYRAALPLLRALLEEEPRARVIVFATTPEVAPTVAETLPADRVLAAYLPYDSIGPALAHLYGARPQFVLFVESFWYPNLLPLARALGAATVVFNFTVKPITFRHTRRFTFRFWLRRAVDLFGVQNEADADALRRLGCSADRIVVTGNAKFDAPAAELTVEDADALRREMRIRHPLCVAGSTHEGEEEAVLDAFARVRAAVPLQLILAPRYVRRAAEIAQLAQDRGFRCSLRSQCEMQSSKCEVATEQHPAVHDPIPVHVNLQSVSRRSTAGRVDSTSHSALRTSPSEEWDVMVLDTMGELARLYSLAAVAFVGGSLAPVGGHNVIEPIAAGVPTFFGPHMAAFRAVATEAMAAGVAWEVPDAAKLSEDWEALLLEPERRREAAVRARELMARSRGATDRMYAALTGMVASVR